MEVWWQVSPCQWVNLEQSLYFIPVELQMFMCALQVMFLHHQNQQQAVELGERVCTLTRTFYSAESTHLSFTRFLLTDCKVCIHQCSNLWENNLSAPYHNLFNSQLLSLCSLLCRSCMVHDICILHRNYWCFIGDNEWSFSSVSWFNHTGKKIGKYWQVSLNSWLTN